MLRCILDVLRVCATYPQVLIVRFTVSCSINHERLFFIVEGTARCEIVVRKTDSWTVGVFFFGELSNATEVNR